MLLRRAVEGRGRGSAGQTQIFLKVRHGIFKPNRWIERSPEMRSLQIRKNEKYEKNNKTIQTAVRCPSPKYPEG